MSLPFSMIVRIRIGQKNCLAKSEIGKAFM